MTRDYDHRICPSCRGEFTLAVTRCSECDVDLVPPAGEEDDYPPAGEEDDYPPAGELICVRVAPEPWIEALSRGLEERGMPHRVEPVAASEMPRGHEVAAFGAVPLFGLYVDDRGEGDARALDREIAAQVLPEQQAAELSEGESESCPACGCGLEAADLECPECGLAFGR